ncbi:MAG: hypothetical protein QS721_09100 [Candidatus Endonucleobacter sp. (ex Gigantidas childressi)]|nr:hypothetical protein [Candidatus Endonucleobacter sp. (ex Gigantidas childressi)]
MLNKRLDIINNLKRNNNVLDKEIMHCRYYLKRVVEFFSENEDGLYSKGKEINNCSVLYEMLDGQQVFISRLYFSVFY